MHNVTSLLLTAAYHFIDQLDLVSHVQFMGRGFLNTATYYSKIRVLTSTTFRNKFQLQI